MSAVGIGVYNESLGGQGACSVRMRRTRLPLLLFALREVEQLGENLSGGRGGGFSSEASLLDRHSNNIARVRVRGECDIPRLVFLARPGFSGTGLARNRSREVGEHRVRGSAPSLRGLMQPAEDRVDVRLVQIQLAPR